jgi:hypothetical protein
MHKRSVLRKDFHREAGAAQGEEIQDDIAAQ